MYYKVKNKEIVEKGILKKLLPGVMFAQALSLKDLAAKGVYPEPDKPEIDIETEMLDGVDVDSNGVLFWKVKDRILITLEEYQEMHREDTRAVIREISSIVSAVKNIYDPLRTGQVQFPSDFQALVNNILPYRTTVYDEIDNLTLETAKTYIVRGPLVEGFISQLKAFL